MYDNILFDLDGTLVNSEKGIFISLRYAFEKCGVTYDGDMHNFIGPAFIHSFPEFLKTDEATTAKLIKYYREKYNACGVFQTTLYRGIKDLLFSLKQSGKRIALATTKPKYFASMILKQKRIYGLFDYIAGTELDGSVNDKDEVLNIIFEKTGFEKARSVLVGDTIYDCIGAQKVGIDCIGVSYGFGKISQMCKRGVTLTAASVKELKKLLLDN